MNKKILALEKQEILSIEHKTLINFLNKYRLPHELERNSATQALKENELSLLQTLISPVFTYTATDYPGMFQLKDLKTKPLEYASAIKDVNSYQQKLIKSYTIPVANETELSTYRNAFLNLSILDKSNKLIDLLTIQEIKKVLNLMLLRYISNNSAQLINPYQSIINTSNSIYLDLMASTKNTNQPISIKDHLLLSLISNFFDFSTSSLKQALTHFTNSERVENLLFHGKIYGKIFDNSLIERLVNLDLIHKNENYFTFTNDSITAYKPIIDELKISDLPTAALFQELFHLSRVCLSTIYKDEKLMQAADTLIQQARVAKHITLITDNAGEVICDLEFLRQLIAHRKDNKPEISIIARQYPVENDIDTQEMHSLLLNHYADLLPYVTIEENHCSTMLGHDPREFSPILLEKINNSLIIAKGLGNILTMQMINKTHETFYVLVSKGFMGQRIAELLGHTQLINVPIIEFFEVGKDLRPEFKTKYL